MRNHMGRTPRAAGTITSDGESVQAKIDQAAYPTRALFVTDVAAGRAWADGDVVPAGPVSYVKSTGATEIPDLLGWLPYGDLAPDHFSSLGDAERFGAQGSITSGTTTFTSASTPFSAANIGRLIRIDGAGAAGSKLVTTIVSMTSTSVVEVADAASTTVASAIWTMGTDSTAGFDAMFDYMEDASAAGAGYLSTTQRTIMGPINPRKVSIPGGHYLYNGAGYNPSSPRGRAISIEGAGRNSTLIEITSDAFLIHRLTSSVSAENSVDISHLDCMGGKGLYYNEKDTGVPQAYHRFHNAQIADFTVAGIASLADGVPRWQVTDCWIESAHAGSKGVLFNPEFANPNMRGTTIVDCAYKIVCPDEGVSAGWLSGLTMFNTTAAVAVADIWFRTGAVTTQGRGISVTDNRFSSEHRAGTPIVLIADVDVGSGSSSIEYAHSTSLPATNVYFRGASVSGNFIDGQGNADDPALAGPMVVSYTGEIGAFSLEGNSVVPAFTEFLFLGSAPTTGYASDLKIGPNKMMGKGEPPKFCNMNIGRWYAYDGSELYSAGTNLQSDGGWDHTYVLLSKDGGGDSVVPADWVFGGSAANSPATGPFGQATAEEVTFTIADDTDYVQIPVADFGTIEAGQNCFVEFDVEEAAARAMTEVDVEVLMTFASGSETVRKHTVPAGSWRRNRVPFQANEALTALRVRVYPSPDAFSAGVTDRVNLDNIAVYAANRPVNSGHDIIQSSGWQSGHTRRDEYGGQDRLHQWPDWTAGLQRFKIGAPTAENDGLALVGAIVSNTGAMVDFSPVIEGSTTAGAGTYGGLNEGRWMQIGPLALGFVRIPWTAHTGTGNIQIDLTGLPPTRNDPTSRGLFFPYLPDDFTLTAGTSMAGYMTHNTNQVIITERGNTGDAAVAIQGTGTIAGLFVYETA